MLQRILADTVWAKGLLAMLGLGVFIRLITIVSYKRMRSAAENAGNTSSIYGSDGTYSSYYSSAYNWYL